MTDQTKLRQEFRFHMAKIAKLAELGEHLDYSCCVFSEDEVEELLELKLLFEAFLTNSGFDLDEFYP